MSPVLFITSLRCKLDYLHVRAMRARLKTFSDVETSCKDFYRRYPMEKITQTTGRDMLGEFSPMFVHLNDDVLFGEV